MNVIMSTEFNEVIKPLSRWQHTTRAFKHYNFRVFFIGQTISMLGTWSQIIALSWLVWELTQSTTWLGISQFAAHFPMFLFTLIGGALADRYNRRSMMIITQSLLTIQAITIATLTLTGVVNIWHILTLDILIGLILSLEIPLRNAFVMDIVGKKDLLNAMSLSHSIFHGTRIVGPVVAGAIVSVAGEGLCFGFNALSFIPLIIALLMIRSSEMLENKPATEHLFASIKNGLGFCLKTPQLKLGLFLSSMIAIVQFSYITLMPVFADKVYKGGALQLGYLMGSGAIGAVIASWYLAQRRGEGGLLLLSTRGMLILGIFLFIFSRAKNIYIALPILVVVGFSSTISITSISTLFQHLSPHHLRGRMASLVTAGFMGLAPIGGLGAGLLANYIGSQHTISLIALTSLIISIISYSTVKKLENPNFRTNNK